MSDLLHLAQKHIGALRAGDASRFRADLVRNGITLSVGHMAVVDRILGPVSPATRLAVDEHIYEAHAHTMTRGANGDIPRTDIQRHMQNYI